MNNYIPDLQLVKEIPIPNCRELGGMPLAGGKSFKHGLFLRASSPHRLDKEGIAKVKEYGIKSVLDLRGEQEIIKSGNPFMNDPDVNFYNVRLLNGDPNDTKDETMQFLRSHILGDYYIIVAEKMGDRLANAMRILLNSDGQLMFHCEHGKDRTGVVAALLYLICGASRENVLLNYKMSYPYLKTFIDPYIEKMPDDLKHALRSDEENMVKFFNYLDEKWDGDPSKLLIANGLTEDEISRLKDKCIGD